MCLDLFTSADNFPRAVRIPASRSFFGFGPTGGPYMEIEFPTRPSGAIESFVRRDLELVAGVGIDPGG
jgi:hypothetical protein